MKTTFLFLTTLFLLFTVFLPNMSLADYTEWNLPEGAITRLGKGTIKDLKLSPDGTLLAVASSIGVWIYDAHTGEELVLLTRRTEGVTSVAFSSDGSTLASGSEDSTIHLWEVSTGRHLKTLKGHKWEVVSVCFSPDGKTLASASFDGTIRLWGVTYGVHLRTLEVKPNSIPFSVAFSGDGQTIVSAVDKEIYLWNAVSGEQHKAIIEHINSVNDIAFSRDGQTIASAIDKEIYLWNAISGEHREILTNHTKSVSSVAFSGDGHTLAYTSGNEIYLWNTASGRQRKISAAHIDSIIGLDFSSNGKTLVSASEVEVCLYDATLGKHLKTLTGHTKPVTNVAFSSDGNILASTSENEIYLWDATSDTQRKTLTGHTESVNDIAFSDDSNILASASSDKTIQLWNAISGQRLKTLTGHTNRVNSVVFSSDGQTIASASGKEIYLWDAVSGERFKTLTGHTNRVNSVTFIGDSKLAGATVNKIYLWDFISGEHKETFTMSRNIYNIAFFSGALEESFAAADQYGKIHVWEWDSLLGEWNAFLDAYQKRTFTIEDTGLIITSINIAFGGRGDILASTDRSEICLWDVTSGTQRKTLKGHTNPVSSVAFSGDGHTLASASRDGTVLLWNGSIPQSLKLRKEDIAKKAMASTVVIGERKSRLGSGFVLFDRRMGHLIVTNYHVAEKLINGYVKLVNRDGFYKIKEIIAIDKENDLAILKIKGYIPAQPLRLGDSNKVEFYAPVCAVGNPKGVEGTPSWGNVTNTQGGNSKKLFQIDAAVSKGSSGGPLLNDRGEVIGIVVGGVEEGLDLNFAIPSNYLQELIDKMKQRK